jgi:hypothetical protein
MIGSEYHVSRPLYSMDFARVWPCNRGVADFSATMPPREHHAGGCQGRQGLPRSRLQPAFSNGGFIRATEIRPHPFSRLRTAVPYSAETALPGENLVKLVARSRSPGIVVDNLSPLPAEDRTRRPWTGGAIRGVDLVLFPHGAVPLQRHRILAG